MSRIGKAPVPIPDGVKISHQGRTVTCTGPKGTLTLDLMKEISMVEEDGQLIFKPTMGSRQTKAYWGLMRSLVDNMVKGVSVGWHKELEIRGIGFRAAMQGKTLKLNLGYSHDIDYLVPDGIEIKCDRPTSISITGIDKQKIGQVAAEIRAMRSPEPYKGKGVRYLNEYVMQKEGKKK